MEKGIFVGGRSERAIEKDYGEGTHEEEVEEEKGAVVTSIVEDACAPTLRAFGSSASTRLKYRDDVKARVAMHRDRHRASEQEVIPLR